MILDSSFSADFHATGATLVSLGWVAALTTVVVGLLVRRISVAGN